MSRDRHTSRLTPHTASSTGGSRRYAMLPRSIRWLSPVNDDSHAADRLPIAPILPAILASLRANQHVVVQAPPGAGKTTGLPLAWLADAATGDGEMVVVQPRRLAARLPAHYIARCLGESVGERCGYQVRFDTRVSSKTRIRFVTEGVFIRQLLHEPTLPGVSVLVLDEFHERRLDADLALALLRRLHGTRRPDLRIVVMSATLNPGPLVDFLSADFHASEGRMYPVAIEHATKPSTRPVERQVLAALTRLVSEDTPGDVLVFLPGRAEIERTRACCTTWGTHHGFDLVTLYGELSPEQQDAATRRGPRRKIIWSTNGAETSITVEGIGAVVDSGLARRAGHDPWSGLPSLELRPIARASAEQRAGRAGRVGPGRCLRLYTQADYARRPAHDVPDIQRMDLTAALLTLLGCGVDPAREDPWFEAPPATAVAGAVQLLEDLGALHGGCLTERGHRMLRYPVHPRHARVLDEARQRNVANLAAGVVAVLEERSIHLGEAQRAAATAADPLADWELLRSQSRSRDREPRGGSASARLRRDACYRITRVHKALLATMGNPTDDPADDPDEALCIALLAGYPDRVAKVRTDSSGGRTLALADGGHAVLANSSAVTDAEFVIALRAHQHRGSSQGARTVVDEAAAVTPEMFLELFPDRIDENHQVRFDPVLERIVATGEIRYRGLLLDSSELHKRPPEATEVLSAAALDRGLGAFAANPEALAAWLDRLRFVITHSEATLSASVDDLLRDVLRHACADASSFAELRRIDWIARLEGSLPPGLAPALHRLAPATVTLSAGRALRVHYEAGRDPWVESRLQDFFGLQRGPAILDGRLPLVLHLLAPNRRAVQVTRDLDGFWREHYPELRRALARRYPKHAWPDDPRTAGPPSPGGARRRSSSKRR